MATARENPPSTKSDKTLIEKTFELLESGNKKIQLQNQFKKIVLVVGETGNGKTVFTNWIAGDHTNLIAEETKENYGEYIINSIHGTKSSTITSETVYPTLVVDTETNVPYYDCPGFNDTRSTVNDIATTYFIKKILYYAESVKIILIVNYPSVRKGLDRHNFKKLLRHATDCIKDVEKFKNSIGIVVTKVDNLYIKGGTIMVDDSKVIALIADFLEEVKHDLAVNFHDSSFQEKRFYEASIKLISYLLQKDGAKYEKIGIFRRPDQSGPLNEILLLRKCKDDIKRIINQNLTFTDKIDDDFGYTISDTSKNDISRFINAINENVWRSVNHITNQFTQHHRTLTDEIRRTIRTFECIDSPPEVDQIQAEKLSSHLRQGRKDISNLIKHIESVVSPFDLAKIITNCLGDLEIGVSKEDILYIENQGRYFNFLQVVSEDKLNTRTWDELFRRILTSVSEHLENIQADIDRVVPHIHKHILSCFESTAKNLQNQLDEKIKILDIHEVLEELNNYNDSMQWLVEKSTNATSIKHFLKLIRDVTSRIMINVPNDNISNIIKLENCLKYLQTFNERDYNSVLLSWVHPFQNIVDHLIESKIWYNFLDSLYCIFSEFEVQKDKKKYNVSDLNNWGKAKANQGIVITEANFQQFLKHISEYKISELENINKIKLTEIRIKELNEVLNLTLKQQITMSRSDRSIFITDDYIRISDFMKDSENTFSFSSIIKSGRIRLIKCIYIFAARTIFIDEDLNFPGLSLGIIAPKWEIVGERKINLDGADGEPHSRPKANNGKGAGGDGEDGEPGLSGKSGGTFIGIGATFINGAHLTITAHGGNGAPGQNGGDGQIGDRGVDAELPTSDDSPSQVQIAKGLTSIKGFACRKIGGKGSVVMNKKLYADYRIFGHSGGRGGNGGNGGKGGAAGKAGVVNLYELDEKSGISKYSERGIWGRSGRGGKGGEGGEGGDNIIVRCEMYSPCSPQMFFGKKRTTNWVKRNFEENDMRGVAGEDGADGDIYGRSRNLEPANTISDPFKIVNEYKKYLIKRLNCRFKRSSLVLFFNKLNEKYDIKCMYNTAALIEEFQMIEEEYSRFSLKQSYFIPIYQSMLSRISEYKDDMAPLKVLTYLHATILSKISILRNVPQTHLIIDLVRYLDMIKEDIVTVKKLKTPCQNLSLISKGKEDYYCNVSKTLEEVQSFVMEHILPAINIMKHQVDNGINSLVEELIELQRHAEIEDHYLIKKQQELEDSWALKQVFCNFKLIAQVVSFLCIVGKSVRHVIETTTSLIGPLTFNKKETPSEEDVNITHFRQAVENGICDITNETLNYLNKLLEYLGNEIENDPESLQDLFSVIEGIKIRKDNVSRKSLGLMEIKRLENSLILELKRKEEILKSEQGDRKLMDDKIQVISRLNKISELGSLVVNIGRKDGDETSKLCELASVIERIDKTFLSLKQYERNLYNSIDKMITNMKDNIFHRRTQRESMTGISLDVTKWQVQSSLRNVQLQMKGLFERVKVQDNVVHCFDMLQEAMSTLIKVYDHIENYQEQQTLANCIADLSSVAVNSINVNDQKLVKYLNHLDIALKSNLILKSYKFALDAFNQSVFPFSQKYIEDSMLLYHFKFEPNIENLVDDCVVYIEHMKNNIEVYKTSVMGNGNYMQHGEFNSQNISNEPFFVWKSEKYKNIISRLLSGEKIELKADVKKSPVIRDAIKFSFIEFHFRCKNASLQPKLDQILSGLDIRATHMGNSYYKYRNKIYLITSERQTIVYSFEKNANGESVRSNDVYDKIRRGELMLSPYTVWQLKLVDSANRFSFDDLRVFKEDIDLELRGYGSYIMNHDLPDLAEEDYRVVEVYNEFDQYLD